MKLFRKLQIKKNLNINSIYQLFSGLELIFFEAFIPVVIIDENRGVLKAEFDMNYNLEKLIDTEIALYQFTKGYKISDNDLDFDYIFIANRNGLKKLFNCIDSFLYTYESKFRKLFEKFPFTLPGLFKEEMRNVNGVKP